MYAKNRLPAVAQVLEAIPLASSTRKFETLASNFSNETRICEAAGVLAIQEKFFYSVVLYRMVTSSNATKAVWIRSIACLTSSSCKVASLFKKRIE